MRLITPPCFLLVKNPALVIDSPVLLTSMCVYMHCRVPPVAQRLVVWNIPRLFSPLPFLQRGILQWVLRLCISLALDWQQWKGKVLQGWREERAGQRCNERRNLVQEMRERWVYYSVYQACTWIGRKWLSTISHCFIFFLFFFLPTESTQASRESSNWGAEFWVWRRFGTRWKEASLLWTAIVCFAFKTILPPLIS